MSGKPKNKNPVTDVEAEVGKPTREERMRIIADGVLRGDSQSEALEKLQALKKDEIEEELLGKPNEKIAKSKAWLAVLRTGHFSESSDTKSFLEDQK
ncbi:MAG: hypothetical protein MMC23_002694 [Stictis urceolatum]|nr:hypothetical protein [Stictis urceolata]